MKFDEVVEYLDNVRRNMDKYRKQSERLGVMLDNKTKILLTCDEAFPVEVSDNFLEMWKPMIARYKEMIDHEIERYEEVIGLLENFDFPGEVERSLNDLGLTEISEKGIDFFVIFTIYNNVREL